ncbi:unnamed protein product, partial [Alternaria alternata]
MPSLVEPPTPPRFNGRFNTGLHAEVMEMSQRILDTIFRYRSPLPKNASDRSDEGAIKFLGQIYRFVKMNKAIRMAMPAFPFKSPNSAVKVLGTMPDKAEDVALAHLNGLCSAIKDIYPPGAVLVIVSDGLVYNDLLGVPDNTVWMYGQELRALTKARDYSHIEFARIKDLLAAPKLHEETDGMTYAATASSIRLTLMNRYGSHNWDETHNDSHAGLDENKQLTYCSYLKFLELDLAATYPICEERSKSRFKRGVEKIAKSMLKRGEAFARAMRENFQDHVRLSIHPSTGEDKISINVLPLGKTMTPWHNTVAFKLDGTLIAGHRHGFQQMSDMELVYEDGRASYFRERSHVYDWATPVTFEPMYPCGIMIRPAQGLKRCSISMIEARKVRELAVQNSPVVLRGFTETRNRERFVAKAHELGVPTPWKFGLVLEVKDHGEESQGLNNVLSKEWMPFHFDGLFKTTKEIRKDGSEHLVPVPPHFQFFAAVTPSPRNTGYTLFSSSKLVFEHLPEEKPLNQLAFLT